MVKKVFFFPTCLTSASDVFQDKLYLITVLDVVFAVVNGSKRRKNEEKNNS